MSRGEMPEWLNGPVSKTVIRANVSRVRIPLSPPDFLEITFLPVMANAVERAFLTVIANAVKQTFLPVIANAVKQTFLPVIANLG